MNTDFSIIIDNVDLYFSGFLTTLLLTFVSLFLGLILAIIFSIIKYGSTTWLIKIVNIIVFYFCGTPCLLQIYIIYFGFAQFEFVRNSIFWVFFSEPMFCALLALTLNTASYTTQIVYGAIKATSKGEIEAGYAFGFSKFSNLRYIIFPIVFRRIIPLYANESIFLMQATALASTITIVELTQIARIMNSRYFIPFEAFLFAMLFYMSISYVILFFLRLLELRVNKHLLPLN